MKNYSPLAELSSKSGQATVQPDCALGTLYYFERDPILAAIEVFDGHWVIFDRAEGILGYYSDGTLDPSRWEDLYSQVLDAVPQRLRADGRITEDELNGEWPM